MTLPSLLRRLDKIELARRPPRGLFYVAYGRDPDEIEERIGEARRARTIAYGDAIVRCAWSTGSAVPAARWVPDTLHALDHVEFGALMGEVDRFRDDWTAAVRAEVQRRGEAMPDLEEVEKAKEAAARSSSEEARMSDAALFAAVLVVPLDGARSSLTEDRMWRLVRQLEALGLRASIRGHGGVLDQARSTKH